MTDSLNAPIGKETCWVIYHFIAYRRKLITARSSWKSLSFTLELWVTNCFKQINNNYESWLEPESFMSPFNHMWVVKLSLVMTQFSPGSLFTLQGQHQAARATPGGNFSSFLLYFPANISTPLLNLKNLLLSSKQIQSMIPNRDSQSHPKWVKQKCDSIKYLN